MTVGERLFQLGVVLGKPFAKAGLPVAPSPHPPEVIGRGQDEPEQKQDVIKNAHASDSIGRLVSFRKPGAA